MLSDATELDSRVRECVWVGVGAGELVAKSGGGRTAESVG